MTAIEVFCGPSNGKPARLVILRRGDVEHRDKIDCDSAFQRQACLERAAAQFDVAPEELLPLDGELVRQADAADTESAKVRLRGYTTPLKPEKNGSCVAVANVAVPYSPFPVDALPEPIRGFVEAGSAALGVNLAYLGTALIPALASAIGNAAVIRLKPGWTEPAVVWAAVVGPSGDLKSPVLDLVMRSIRQRQARAIVQYEEAEKVYERDKAIYEADKKAWQGKGRAKGEPPPEAPDEPVCTRYYCSDATVEAAAPLLQRCPRGALLARDELSGWLRSFDQYKGGKGGDSAHWLTMHGARDLVVDRKTAGQKPIFVPRAAVSILGGIQPQTLRRALGREHFENGMAARLLLSMPPARTKRWTEATVDGATLRAMDQVFDGLFGLPMNTDADGRPQPAEIALSGDGKAAWVQFYNSHARRLADAQGDHAAMLSKIEGYAARLALVFHLVRLVTADTTLHDANVVDAESISTGIALANWFADEALRVYGILGETEEAQDERELLEWIQRKDRAVTARELQQGPRRFRGDAQLAEEALDSLAKAGIGEWELQPLGLQGGRPTRAFRLFTSGNGDAPPRNTEENIGFDADIQSDPNGEINLRLAESAAENEEEVCEW